MYVLLKKIKINYNYTIKCSTTAYTKCFSYLKNQITNVYIHNFFFFYIDPLCGKFCSRELSRKTRLASSSSPRRRTSKKIFTDSVILVNYRLTIVKKPKTKIFTKKMTSATRHTLPLFTLPKYKKFKLYLHH